MLQQGKSGANAAPPSRIWVLDDSRTQALSVTRAFSSDFDVELFTDGATMLEAFASRTYPELLILDWHMPGLSGFEVCTFIRQTVDAGELPILVVTVANSAEILVQALQAGANDFVVKPFGEKELLARVTALLRNKLLYSKLADAEKRLRVEAEFRERFMSMLAHDLRQPLSTFILATHILAKKASGEPALEMQRRAADRMSRMVNELLDFARTRPETGMPVELQSMDLAVLVEELLHDIRVGHPASTLELVVEGVCTGHWDRERLAQLCTNLLVNAIEHGAPNAPVEIRVRREADAVVLSVSNRGDPIPEAMIPTLFEPFRQGRGSRKGGGVGLGLHIVSEIARAHAGTVEVKSNATSTVFVVTLPVGAPAPPAV
ncbi:MAG TPA: ATP-binding protein [Polyangiaceae bacterium]|jgi:signal transduction histidine kinase